MNNDAIDQVFLDPALVKERSLTSVWVPFKMARLVPEAVILTKAPRNGYYNNSKKRQEFNGNYLQAASASQTESFPPMPAWQDNGTAKSTTSELSQSAAIDKAKIATLEKCMDEMKQRLDQSESHNNNLNMSDTVIDKKVEDSVGRLSNKRSPNDSGLETISQEMIKSVIAEEIKKTVDHLGRVVEDKLKHAVNYITKHAAETAQANGTEGIKAELHSAIAGVDMKLQHQISTLHQTVVANQTSNSDLLAQLLEMRNEDRNDRRLQKEEDRRHKIALQEDVTRIKIALNNLAGPGAIQTTSDGATNMNIDESESGPLGTADRDL